MASRKGKAKEMLAASFSGSRGGPETEHMSDATANLEGIWQHLGLLCEYSSGTPTKYKCGIRKILAVKIFSFF